MDEQTHVGGGVALRHAHQALERARREEADERLENGEPPAGRTRKEEEWTTVRVAPAALIALLERPEPPHYHSKVLPSPKKLRAEGFHSEAREQRLEAEARRDAGDEGEVVVEPVWLVRKARKTADGARAASEMPSRPLGGLLYTLSLYRV
jgi:hypothetical protein